MLYCSHTEYTTMKQILILALVTSVVATYGSMLGGLRIRFGTESIGTDYFIAVPKTVPDAVSEGWQAAVLPPQSHLKLLLLYCHNNKILCLLYDDTGYVAGLQVAIDPDTITDTAFDWETQGWKTWKADNGITYWTIQQYFVSEEFLERTQLDRVQSRNASTLLQDEAVYVTGFNDQLTKIYVDTETELQDTAFTEQLCIPGMGLHYFYNMTPELTCNSDTVFPWFQLTKDSKLVGTGLLLFGNMTENAQRNWFEKPARSAAMAIMPTGPECMFDLVDDPSLNTMHIYYVEEPWTLTC